VLLIGHVRSVRVLCAVAESESFSAAARSLGLTQSGVSQHVATLEKVVGLPLVQRGSRPPELTEAGAALARHGRAVLAQLEGAEQVLGEIGQRRALRLRLGSFPTALLSFVGHALVRLRQRSPALALTVIDDHMQRLVPRLASGELDLALVYEHPALTDEALQRLTRVALFDDPFRVLLPTGHPQARVDALSSVTALAGERWIGGRPGSSWFRIVQSACRSAGFEPRTALTTDDYRAVQAFVAAGLGVAVVPGLAAAHALPGIVVRDLVTAPYRTISVARLADEPILPQAQLMTDLLVETTVGRRGDARTGARARSGAPRLG